MPPWTGRLTSSGSSSTGGGFSPLATAASCSALAFASSIAVSKAIARSTAGSPTVFDKADDHSPPQQRPCRHHDYPQAKLGQRRHRRAAPHANSIHFPGSALPTPAGVGPPMPSVAREAEQMAAVVHEFMHVHA